VEDEIVLALRDLLLNPELRQRMERLGMQRAATFSWDNTAGKTLDLYYAVAGEASRKPEAAMKTISAGH
jgi:glycosyltransferase involved in cell wall biosynthesis